MDVVIMDVRNKIAKSIYVGLGGNPTDVFGSKSTLSNSSNYFISGCSSLTHDSLMNVINGLYDRKTAGYSVISLRFGSTNLAKLTDEEKAIATNKGWTLTT